MTPAEKFYEHLNTQYNFAGLEKTVIHDVIKFVFEKDNWGISFKTHILLQMLQSLNITEADIIHFLIDESDDINDNSQGETING